MLLLSFLTTSVFFSCVQYAQAFKRATTTPKPFADPSPNILSPNVLEFAKSNISTRSSKALRIIQSNYGNTSLTALEMNCLTSSDTGSSDTWVAVSNFECIDPFFLEPVQQSGCQFGPLYCIDATFSEIPNENFNITYGDGEFLTGYLGTENITLAGISVNQTIAAVNFAAWDGDGFSSGLVGLAYPSLTSAFNGTDPTLDNSTTGKQIIYDPIFTTMYKNGLIAPLFSLAIERDLEGPSGYLALGGLPPVDVVQNFTETPILVTTLEFYPHTFDFYTIEIDGLVLNGETLSGSDDSTQYIIDSGTTLNYLPTPFADAVNNAFTPPAISNGGSYIVECNATAPSFGIVINGTTFFHNALDMILPAGTDGDGNELCISGVYDGGEEAGDGLFILGDTFQKNVVTVFDVGAGVLRFAARENYTSDDTW